MSRQIHQERAAEEKPSPASNKNSELSEGYGFVTRSGCRENVQKQPQNNRDRDIGADSVPAGKSHLHSDDRSKAWHSDEESSGVPALVFFVGICGVFAFIYANLG
jgi:hypothetical protein